jgi:hypothetical protein
MGVEVPILEAKATDWMYGIRGGTEVLVRPTRTGALLDARIDPPLLLGLVVVRNAQVEVLLGIGARTGYPPLDTVFRIESHDLHRTSQLLRPRRLDGNDPAQQLVRFIKDDLRVFDTCVQKCAPLAIASLSQGLDSVAWLACQLAARRVDLPETSREHAQREAWRSFASEHGMSFDPLRMDMHGYTSFGDLRICLDGERGSIATLASITFETHLGVSMRVPKPRLVVGYPQKEMERVLARPGVAQALSDLARQGYEVDLSDRDVLLRAQGSTPTTADLERLARDLAQLTSLFAETIHDGPYR